MLETGWRQGIIKFLESGQELSSESKRTAYSVLVCLKINHSNLRERNVKIQKQNGDYAMDCGIS